MRCSLAYYRIMRKLSALILAAGVCLFGEVPTLEQPKPKVLVLKSGQRIVYDDLSKDGGTLFVRSGGQSLMIDAAEVAPEAPAVPRQPVR